MAIRFLHILGFVFAATLLYAAPSGASVFATSGPAVNVVIDISSQSMSVKVNGWPYGRWKVSTARPGYHTPRGTFRVQRTARVYYSRKYIHGSYYVRSLGRPASHGCVRLLPANAARLYNLVQKYGSKSTRITIVD
jgi:lipoprotein-anchoring transpeptidase ErfK/SrfK